LAGQLVGPWRPATTPLKRSAEKAKQWKNSLPSITLPAEKKTIQNGLKRSYQTAETKERINVE